MIQKKELREHFMKEFGLFDTGQIASGIMKGYNLVSLTT